MSFSNLNTVENIQSTRHERTPGKAAVMGYEAEATDFSVASPISASIPGQIPGGQGTESPECPSLGYKDSIANPATDETTVVSDTPPLKKCPGYMIVGECANGHRYAKELHCGKETCSVCGQDNSVAHRRRIARLMPKVQQIQKLGYLVIEFPDKYRKIPGWTYSRRGLRAATKRIVDCLAGKRQGRKGRVGGFFARGILRWHWFGDKLPGKWNPHVNVLVDAGYISDAELETIKAKLRQALMCPDLIVHYSYFDNTRQMMNKVEYVTRATFLDESWDGYMASQLYGFRNIRWWGTWSGPSAWSLPDESYKVTSDLESGHCPKCHEKIAWGKPVDIVWLQIERVVNSLGDGYYELDSS